MSAADPRIDCIVLTGFLGSGKTTALGRLLKEPDFADTAVIVNEFGEVGIDHDLIAEAEDAMLVLPGGCVCCAFRSDIEVALRDLFAARDEGRIPPFRRLAIETTGLADPLPLIMTLHQNPLALERLTRPQIVTVVDGVLGAATLVAHPEAESQAVHADRILISKVDLASGDEREALRAALRGLNPWAAIEEADLREAPVAALFDPVRARKPEENLANAAGTTLAHGDVSSVSFTLDAPLDWTGFGVWMTLLLHRHGDKVLRAKGLLSVDGLPGPTVFQSAQHLVHPPQHLPAWPSDDRRTRLVFIVRALDGGMLKRSLLAFDRAARHAPEKLEHYLPAGGGGSIAGRPIRRPTAPRWIKA